MLSSRLFNLTNQGRFKSALFAEQRAYIDDKNDIVSAVCTRRSGKSVAGFASLYLTGMQYPNSILPYITLTRRSCKNIIWPVMKEQNQKHNLGIEFKVADLEAVLPNGARIILYGADTEAFIERLLGGKYPEIVIDEAQSFGAHLDRLVFDVLQPATMDYNGTIRLQGTPGPIPHGLFFDLTKDGTEHHAWSVLNNPYIPHAKDWIETLKKRRNWTDDNPTFQREYCGKWVHDPDSLVYKFSFNRNTYSMLPNIGFNYIIGLDYGWNDQTAFAVIAYSNEWPLAYVVDCYGKSEMIPSKIAEELQKLIIKYNPERIVADTGGLGKSITEEMKLRYSLPIFPAEKTDKMTAIDTLNGDFIDGKVLINAKLTHVHNQYMNLTWDEKRKENPSLPNDYCDSILYPLRFSRHYWGKIPPTKLTAEEILAKQEKDMLESVLSSQKEKIYESRNFESIFNDPQNPWSNASEDW